MIVQFKNKKEGRKSIILLLGLLFCLFLFPTAHAAKWQDTQWRYRIPIEINASIYSRVDWPVEIELNFTAALLSISNNNSFDINSTRVFECDSNGSILREVSSQFDADDYFNASTNAAGTIVFLMNGTTSANKSRYYQIYFDTIERTKSAANYTTNFSWTGQNAEEFNVNNSIGNKGLRWYIDTRRGENTSGLYKVQDQIGNNIFSVPAAGEKTIEYMQYTNGTYNYSFDLRNKSNFKYTGPVRIVVEQIGNETIWDLPQNITEGRITKRYIFYAENQWIRIEQNFTNTASYNITRSSTPAGALAIDIQRAGLISEATTGNSSNPGSWWWFPNPVPVSRHIGIINANSSSSDFFADNRTEAGRGGIHLNSTEIPANSSIWEVAALHFNSPTSIGGSPSETQVLNLRNRLISPANITQQPVETWQVITDTKTDFSIYNRGEDILIRTNVSYDPDALVAMINATLTTPSGDNQTIILYDDGTHGDSASGDKNFTNYFNISTTSTLGMWNVTSYSYDSDKYFLNKSHTSFNVTNLYDVTTIILNPIGIVNRTINFSLEIKNFRTDKWISNATLNCSFDNTLIDSNYTNGNGTYFLNFTAPSDYGAFILNCSVNKSGNQGSDTDYFFTETFGTSLYINITFAIPGWVADNVTLWNNQSFEVFVNLSNAGNGTALETNLTFQLPQRWTWNSTVAYFGNISVGMSVTKMFFVNISNATIPSNYSLNATANWSNNALPQGNTSGFLNVTVLSNPVINVSEDLISGVTPVGQTTVLGNFTIYSIGNDALQNITFNVIDFTWNSNVNFTFLPQNISSLPMANNSSVQVSVSVPYSHPGGVFTGILNITSSNDGSDNITIEIMVPITNMSIIAEPKNITVSNMEWYDYMNFTISANTSNTGNATAYDVNITIALPDYWTTNSTDNKSLCGNISIGENCSRLFTILAKQTVAGNYSFNVTVEWVNPGIGVSLNQTSINVSVTENPEFTIVESFVAGGAFHGMETLVGNFTLFSIGNANVSLENYTVDGFPNNFSFTFSPSIAQFPILLPGQDKLINLNATVDLAFPPGDYNGNINISTLNNGSRILPLNVTVPVNKTWLMNTTPSECRKVTWSDVGIVCNVTINNTGNLAINFTITVLEANWQNITNISWVNETSFTVQKQSSHILSVWWNVTNATRAFYSTNYTINATQEGTPPNRTLYIYLEPYLKPTVNITVYPQIAEQSGSVIIYANVTDASGTGISYARINVTMPSGTMYNTDMSFVETNGSVYVYNISYPSTWGDSSLWGYYDITIYAVDGVGMTGISNETFYLYPILNATTKTGWADYFVGESGSVYCNVSDGLAQPFVSNATITVYDSVHNMRFNDSYETSPNGTLSIIPSFQIPSDAPIGNYLLSCNAFYTPPVSMNFTPNGTGNYTFNVMERYDIEFETAIVWYVSETIMNFYILLYTDSPIEAPDAINLTVYDPAQQIYFEEHDKSNFEIVSQTNNSILYLYEHTISPTTVAGYYLADLSLWQGSRETKKIQSFRFSEGGPYDVVIQSLEAEVPRGEKQDFTILIENMGDVPQDVILDYWITSSDNSTVYSYVYGQPVWVDAGANRTFDRNLSIYSDQPLGDYSLHVKMSYSSIKPALHTQQGFRVIESVSPPIQPPGPTGGGGGLVAPVIVPRMSILNIFPDELLIERGGVAYIIVEVKNLHTSELYKVSSFFEGIPADWFDSIREIDTLAPSATGYLIIKFKIPSDTTAKLYPSRLKVSAIGADDVFKDYNIEVFESKEELLKARLRKMRELITTLEVNSGEVAEEGGDVTNVLRLLERANSLVDIGEEYINEKRLVEATQSLEEAKNVLEQARYELSIAKPLKTKIISIIPKWVYVLAGLLIIIVIIIIIIARRLFKSKIKEVEKVASKKLIEEAEESKAPATSKEIIDIIKSQYESGHISKETYEELRRRYLEAV